ncbi:uncharacterized protein LOC109516990 isoform X7 [Hippocampus comes]|uniref:uncharacterized protein LOC109516990 isoform X7 n=1 Tax=Hippocampus comes TaxID=109280 RepID=UPI00094EFADB|nr:PREDICTED: uncharacterized protein LOC109516990 isoform X7 [Hippocampus comes]
MSTRNAVVSCHKLSGLQVRGFYSNKLIPLPVTYSRTFIPANIDHIPTPETAKVWPHLEHIANEIAPLQGCDVGLLIGYNCSQALVPRQVLTGKEDQPFGLKTDLGWSIVGFGNPCLDYGDAIGLSHRIIVKQVMPSIKSSSNLSSEVHYVNRTQIKEIVSPADVIKMLESDFVEKASEDIKMSQEDIRFMTKLKESIKHKDNGHYEMPLPFKTEKPDLPNNKECAIHRLRLHKFVSNSAKVLATLPKEECAVAVKDLDVAPGEMRIERALGVQWCVESDQFQFRIVVKKNPFTRRGVLSSRLCV